MASTDNTVTTNMAQYSGGYPRPSSWDPEAAPSPQRFVDQLREVEFHFATTFPADWTQHPAYREVAAWPHHFDPGRFSRAAVRAAISSSAGNQATVALLAHDPLRPFVVTQDGYEDEQSWINTRGEPEHVHWQVRRSGFMYQRACFSEDLARGDHAQYVSTDATVAYAATAVDAVGCLYKDLIDPDEPVTVRVRLTGTQGRKLTSELDEALSQYPSGLTEVISESDHTVSELRSRRATVVTHIAAELMEQCGRVVPPSRELRALVDRHVAAATCRRLSRRM